MSVDDQSLTEVLRKHIQATDREVEIETVRADAGVSGGLERRGLAPVMPGPQGPVPGAGFLAPFPLRRQERHPEVPAWEGPALPAGHRARALLQFQDQRLHALPAQGRMSAERMKILADLTGAAVNLKRRAPVLLAILGSLQASRTVEPSTGRPSRSRLPELTSERPPPADIARASNENRVLQQPHHRQAARTPTAQGYAGCAHLADGHLVKTVEAIGTIISRGMRMPSADDRKCLHAEPTNDTFYRRGNHVAFGTSDHRWNHSRGFITVGALDRSKSLPP